MMKLQEAIFDLFKNGFRGATSQGGVGIAQFRQLAGQVGEGGAGG